METKALSMGIRRLYFGMGIYGKASGRFEGLEVPFRLIRYLDSHMVTNKLNLLSISPPWPPGTAYPPKTIHRMKRGASWDKLFTAFIGETAESVGASCVPSSRLKGLDSSFLITSNPLSMEESGGVEVSRQISYTIFGGNCDEEKGLFDENPCEIFRWILDLEIGRGRAEFGFLQLFPRRVALSLLPSTASYYADGEFLPVPLVNRVAEKRMRWKREVRKLPKEQVPPWNGEPFNLFWLNAFQTEVAKQIDFAGFLRSRCGFVESEIYPSDVPRGWYHTTDNGFLIFCLSGDVRDALEPEPEYAARYNKILDYLLEKNFIHHGIF